jgi:hypothetical protein
MIAEVREKHHATAKKSLENHDKRCSAGLIASAGQFSLNEEVLAYVRHTKEQEEARVHQQMARKKDIYDALRVKVQAVREKNLPAEKWTIAELNSMLQWYKHGTDTAMPTKKAEKLARYHQICNRGDPPEPELHPLPPLPPPQPASKDEPHNLPVLDDDRSGARIDDDASKDLAQLLGMEV